MVELLTVSMATSHDTKQALYRFFQYVLTTTNPLQKSKFLFLQHIHIVSS